jgi:hypothetical protein
MAERLPEYLPPIHQLCGRGFFLLLITCMAINNLDQLLEEKGDLAWAISQPWAVSLISATAIGCA